MEIRKLNSNMNSMGMDKSTMNKGSTIKIIVIEEDGHRLIEEDIQIDENDEESFDIHGNDKLLSDNSKDEESDCDSDIEIYNESSFLSF